MAEELTAPAWAEFDELEVVELEPRSPADELADVLRRSRADLEAAVRAGADSRAEALRALAEQAVLAVELEDLLERDALRAGEALPALRALKDRMLAHVGATGLEVVRLRGASAGSVRDIVDVESWRIDDGYACEVVADELEVAVRLDGVAIRKGRVVMGAPRASDAERAYAHRSSTAADRLPPAPARASAGSGVRVVCPIDGCGAENEPTSEFCVGCLAQIGGYVRLALHAGALYNRGLRAARAGDSRRARDLFAAVVQWQPDDVATRNAYALACMDLLDWPAARGAWEEVLALAPHDPVARRGLAALAATAGRGAPGGARCRRA